MEKYLRDWRQAATEKNEYEAAIFVGDKVLALTKSDDDALRLAHLHFLTGNFFRALNILSRNELSSRNLECKHLAANCLIKQGKYDEALGMLGDRTPHDVLAACANNRRKIPRTDGRVATTKNPRSRQAENTSAVEPKTAEEASNMRLHAGMCYLRGLCYAKQNAFDRAKDCYKDAVRIDVQCFEAFDQLMKNALMSPDEEWEFMGSLNFDLIKAGGDPSASQQAGEMTRMLYTSRLSKFKNAADITAATETLSTHYKLASNPDMLLSKAQIFYTQCRFREALALTETILADDHYNFAALPLHVCCLYEQNERNALFLLAHDFADRHPEEPATWLAVGVYYLSTGKCAEARRFFSKASMMDPHFGPAWIGFAHTFAAEGEHDQAIAAYTTSARLFQGTHLPQLFLAQQNIALSNLTLAREYLNAAYGLCQTDPLLLNEMGIVFYNEENLKDAAAIFSASLSIAQDVGADPRLWVATRSNLGHVYRKMSRWDDALEEFNEVLRLGGPDSTVFSAKALVLLEVGQAFEATVALHEALAANPQDPIANDLLSKALEELSVSNVEDEAEDAEIEAIFEAKKQAADQLIRINKGKRRMMQEADAMDEE